VLDTARQNGTEQVTFNLSDRYQKQRALCVCVCV